VSDVRERRIAAKLAKILSTVGAVDQGSPYALVEQRMTRAVRNGALFLDCYAPLRRA
jgi:hypothetical protein